SVYACATGRITAWSAARLTLKIARFTFSPGSLSVSTSSAFGEAVCEPAQPPQHSRRPTTTADESRVRSLRCPAHERSLFVDTCLLPISRGFRRHARMASRHPQHADRRSYLQDCGQVRV